MALTETSTEFTYQFQCDRFILHGLGMNLTKQLCVGLSVEENLVFERPGSTWKGVNLPCQDLSISFVLRISNWNIPAFQLLVRPLCVCGTGRAHAGLSLST